MGYTTEFEGEIEIDPPLNDHERDFLLAFEATRRMKRRCGPLFVRGTGYMGQNNDIDVIDSNSPPSDQPGLWMRWTVSSDGGSIYWNGVEKFYYAAEWMKYLIDNLFSEKARAYIDAHITEDVRLSGFTCDHVFNGEIQAQGEDPSDLWRLFVENNVVKTQHADFVWGAETVV